LAPNLISSTRTTLCHHTHSAILGFNFGFIAISSTHHLHSNHYSSRTRLLRPPSGISSFSSAHETIMHLLAPYTTPSYPFSFHDHLSPLTSQYLVFAPRVASSLLPAFHLSEIIMCHGSAQCTCLPSTLTIAPIYHLLLSHGYPPLPISFAYRPLILLYPLLIP